MRVLVVKLSSFGDVIHTFPALTDAVAARPDLTFDWLVDAAFAGLAAAHPAVGTVHEVAHRSLRWPPRRWPDLVRQLRTLRGAFRARRYDLVIDAQGLMKSAALARLAGAPVVGLDRNSAREPTASALYGRRVAIDRRLHAVERTRRLFADALGYDRPAAPGRFGLVARTEAARPYGLLMHAASWPSKLWPEARWRALAGRLSDHGASFVLPWGDAAERARAERIAAGIPGARVLPDRLAGAELIALLGGARWAIGLDSGLMHLAAALDVPGIWLFGPTDPGLTGPYGPDQTVLVSDHAAAPCRLRRCTAEPDGLCCMRGIGLDRVVDAWAALLSVSGQPPSAER